MKNNSPQSKMLNTKETYEEHFSIVISSYLSVKVTPYMTRQQNTEETFPWSQFSRFVKI